VIREIPKCDISDTSFLKFIAGMNEENDSFLINIDKHNDRMVKAIELIVYIREYTISQSAIIGEDFCDYSIN